MSRVLDQATLDRVAADAARDLEAAGTADAAQAVRVKYLGRKGVVTELFKGLGAAAAAARPILGARLNEIKAAIETGVEARLAQAREAERRAALERGRIDVTLPGRQPELGHVHLVSRTIDEVVAIFRSFGFGVAEGPEVELDYYNFTALNFPRDHPARDMQDTFWIDDEVLLRTHTSPMQARVMERQKPPVAVVVPGRVYRSDYDATHSPMFHQCEGLLVDEGVSFADLKGTLHAFAREMFGSGIRTRFRPSFFPFTEPSAEMDIQCVECRGSGCRVCGQSGWLEILGSGMVNPNVYGFVGYDPEKLSGFAFGMGMERVAMLKYGINDLRLFFENDVRFLGQF
ncbi:MAG TPA: phenylalanine--tRNA ligase subunit alpha [Thermodesulfobacteriota bacterium]